MKTGFSFPRELSSHRMSKFHALIVPINRVHYSIRILSSGLALNHCERMYCDYYTITRTYSPTLLLFVATLSK